jgi:opacity protein-like surface antigen
LCDETIVSLQLTKAVKKLMIASFPLKLNHMQMKKLLLLTAISSILAFSSASAQNSKDPAMNGSKLGVGVEFGLPVGDFGDVFNLGVGGSLVLQIPVATNLNFTGSAGYLKFSNDSDDIIEYSVAAIPVKAGLRYYFAENFYGAGELGAAFYTGDNSTTAFAYAPGIGVEFPVANKAAIDLGVRYEGWSANSRTNSFVGIRAAFNFGL